MSKLIHLKTSLRLNQNDDIRRVISADCLPLSNTKSIRSLFNSFKWFQTASWSSRNMNSFWACWASLPTDCRRDMSSSVRWVRRDKSWIVQIWRAMLEKSRWNELTVAFPLNFDQMRAVALREITHQRDIWIISLNRISKFSGSFSNASFWPSNLWSVVAISFFLKKSYMRKWWSTLIYGWNGRTVNGFATPSQRFLFLREERVIRLPMTRLTKVRANTSVSASVIVWVNIGMKPWCTRTSSIWNWLG